jgi:hypothetical protein
MVAGGTERFYSDTFSVKNADGLASAFLELPGLK